MIIHITCDATQIRQKLGALASQVPYALASGINYTLYKAKDDLINVVSQNFIIRRPPFLRNSLVVQKATKENLRGVLYLRTLSGRSSPFAKFESDILKRSTTGKDIAIPTDNVLKSPTSIIPKSKRPKALQNKFVVEIAGVKYLAVKPTRNKLKLMYVLKPEVDISGTRLHFYSTIETSIRANIQAKLQQTFNYARRTARI